MRCRIGRESRGYLVAGCAFFLVLEAMLYAAIVRRSCSRSVPSRAKRTEARSKFGSHAR